MSTSALPLPMGGMDDAAPSVPPSPRVQSAQSIEQARKLIYYLLYLSLTAQEGFFLTDAQNHFIRAFVHS